MFVEDEDFSLRSLETCLLLLLDSFEELLDEDIDGVDVCSVVFLLNAFVLLSL